MEEPVTDQGCGSTKGIFRFENNSSHSHQVLLSGTNFGTVPAHSDEEWYVTPGEYALEIRDLNSNGGCSTSNIWITECNTTGRSCSH